MTTQTEPDVEVESWSTERLANYINEVAPVAASLGDDDGAADVLAANAKAAIDEFKKRNAPVADGGEVTVDSILDDAGEGDHYLRHVTDKVNDHKIRHEQSVRTRVADGVIVHDVTESVSDDAHDESVSMSFPARCPCDDHDDTDFEERTVERPNEDHDVFVTKHYCTADGCPFFVEKAEVDKPVGSTGYGRPAWYRARIPAGCLEVGLDWEAAVEDADPEDVETVANMARSLALGRYSGVVNDSAYVSAEFEGSIDDGTREKVADAYIDTVECARCGDEVDAGVERTHPHFGDVCPECEDATVWSEDDADLPDDVVDRMNDHKSFSVPKIRALLRDVIYFGNYVASTADEEDDVDPEAVTAKTGSQGKRNMGDGDYKAGTGLRRSKDGVFNGMSTWRTLLADAVDTGLIRRADDRDVDDEDANAAWEATDKGREVFGEVARCKTCGGDLKPFKRVSHYKAGRRTESSTSLTLACPACKAKKNDAGGALVLESSHDSALVTLPGVEY